MSDYPVSKQNYTVKIMSVIKGPFASSSMVYKRALKGLKKLSKHELDALYTLILMHDHKYPASIN